jgi:hypothetical protein
MRTFARGSRGFVVARWRSVYGIPVSGVRRRPRNIALEASGERALGRCEAFFHSAGFCNGVSFAL